MRPCRQTSNTLKLPKNNLAARRACAIAYRVSLYAIFLLWPIVASLGGMGFTVLVSVAGLCGVAAVRPLRPLPRYAFPLVAFIGFALVSHTWSPANAPLVTGSLLTGDFGVTSPVVRLGVWTGLASIFVVVALRLSEADADRFVLPIVRGGGIHGLTMVLFALALPFIYQLIAPFIDTVIEAPQNFIRSANLFVLILCPLATALILRFGRSPAVFAVLFVLTVAAGAADARLDAQSALLGLGLIGLVGAGVLSFQTHGWQVVMSGIALTVLSMPWLVRAIYAVAGPTGDALPESFRYRVWCWQLVADKITEKPIIGHGLEAASTWKETFKSYPEWLAASPDHWAKAQIVPGHPHNMALEIWAETGIVGAGLAAAALVAIGWALPAPKDFSKPLQLAIVGVIGASFSPFLVAYSVWNDAYWSAVLIAVVICIILCKAERWQHAR